MIKKKKFATATFDLKDKAFVIHIVSISLYLDIYLSNKVLIASLKADEVSTSILSEYADFANIFFKDLVVELSKYIKINNYTIDLIKRHQPLYKSIYNLKSLELETLKAYIKINLANSFIKYFESPASAPILFIKKSDGSFQLCINY